MNKQKPASDLNQQGEPEIHLHEQRRRQMLERVVQIGQAITPVTDLRTCLLKIRNSIRQELGFDRVGLFLYDAEARVMRGTFGTSRTGELTEEWDLVTPIATHKPWRTILNQPEGFLFTPDFEAEYDTPTMIGVKNHAAVVARAGDKPIAALVVDNLLTHRQMTGEQLEALRLFAGYAGLAIENSRLLEQLSQRAAELTMINSISQAVPTQLEFDALITLVGDKIRETFATQTVYIALYDHQTNLIHFPYYFDQGRQVIVEPYPLGPGLTSLVIQSQQPLLLGTLQQQMELGALMTGPHTESYLGAPIIVADTAAQPISEGVKQIVIGVLSLQNYKPNTFTQADERLLTTVAASIGVAIQNARLFEAEKRRVALLTALHETGLNISAQLNLATLLQTITERAAHLARGTMGSLYILQSDLLELKVRYKVPIEYISFRMRIGQGLGGKVAETAKPIVVPDYHEWPDQVTFPTKPPWRSQLGVPMLWQGRVLGVIKVSDERPNRFGPNDVEIVQLFAAQAAVAIENARLFEATHRQLNELTILHSAATAAAATANEKELLEQVFQVIQETLSPDIFGILLWDEAAAGLRPVVGWGAPPEMDATIFALGQGIVGTVAAQGRPRRVSDVRFDPIYIVGLPDIRSELCVPLKIGERVIGVIDVESKKLDAFSEADERLLITLARQLATAIERLRAQAERERLITELEAKNVALARSNRELQDFAYVASHDLQEPLRKIRTFGDRLKAKYSLQLGEHGQDYLSRMQSAASRMQTLIQDLLAFSRVTTQAQPFVFVDLNTVLQNVLTDLEMRLEETGGQVELADLPVIEADLTQMQQLFQNLLSNALKFHRQGEAPRVKITSEVALAEAICRISVADNGIGFEEKYVERIFGVFQRLHEQGKYEGNGVGLAICRKIVERHRGKITTKSTPNQGATFIVTLPLKQVN
jgi:GAF domain-containing protein